MNARERMAEQIRNHGEDLNRIFGLTDDPTKTAKMVHRFEVKAHRLATDYCNGENGVTTDNWEEKSDAILDALNKKLNFRRKGIPVFVNGDARGYALKIHDEYIRQHDLKIHRDWGGYGILAPEFDGR